VRQDAQSRAVGPLLYTKIIDDLHDSPKARRAEASWILATNHPMNSAIEGAGGTRYKTWRMYRRKALPG
jgi:hypothetical protein